MTSLAKTGAQRDGHRRPGANGDDRIERAVQRPQTHWDTILIWFMRIVALLWVVKGVFNWAVILDVLPNEQAFQNEPFGRQAAAVYFAVMDFTAAVGLWLTSAWGGVVWLIAVTSSITFAVIAPQLLGLPVSVLAVETSVVVAYFVLSWLAARDVKS